MKDFILMVDMMKQVLNSQTSIYDMKVKTIDGKSMQLDTYKDKVLLIVNVASKCKFTQQYENLEKLYLKYKDQGLVILGFPCNQFLNQEPENEEAIQSFCSLTYNVTFPMFSKIDVNGSNTHELYAYLKSASKGFLGIGAIKWNFTKFLVSKEGRVLQRYSPITQPLSIEDDIKAALEL